MNYFPSIKLRDYICVKLELQTVIEIIHLLFSTNLFSVMISALIMKQIVLRDPLMGVSSALRFNDRTFYGFKKTFNVTKRILIECRLIIVEDSGPL